MEESRGDSREDSREESREDSKRPGTSFKRAGALVRPHKQSVVLRNHFITLWLKQNPPVVQDPLAKLLA